MHGHHLRRGLWSALLVEDHPQASKDPPGLFLPHDAHDKKGILHHSARSLAAGNRKLKTSALARLELRQGGECLFLAPKPAMGQARSQELERMLTQVLYLPDDKPPMRGRPSMSGHLLNVYLWNSITLCFHTHTQKGEDISAERIRSTSGWVETSWRDAPLGCLYSD